MATTGLRYGADVGIRGLELPEPAQLPVGGLMELPGRGRSWVIDTGAPYAGAPTLLLFHGISTTGLLTWFTSIAALQEHYRVVLFDQRWHGRGIVSERFDLDECADDAAALLDLLGIDKVVAVGYSMGGALAQTFWRTHSSRVAGLVLCSTAMTWRGHLGEAAFYPVLGLLNGRFRDRHREQVLRRGTSLPEIPHMAGTAAGWMWSEFRTTSAWALPEVLGELSHFDARDWMREVDVPTAVVVTGSDRVIPTSRQLEIARTVPDARQYVAPGGHSSLIFDSKRWLPLFLDAVAEVTASTASTSSAADSA